MVFKSYGDNKFCKVVYQVVSIIYRNKLYSITYMYNLELDLGASWSILRSHSQCRLTAVPKPWRSTMPRPPSSGQATLHCSSLTTSGKCTPAFINSLDGLWVTIRLFYKPYFYQSTVFFSHNKSATVFLVIAFQIRMVYNVTDTHDQPNSTQNVHHFLQSS